MAERQVLKKNGLLEFHIYPQNQEVVKQYNQYRKTGDMENLKNFENKCTLRNAIILIIRTSDNKDFVNVLTNILLNKGNKIKGFCVIDLNEDTKEEFEKNRTDKYFDLSDIIRQFAAYQNIELFDGAIEEYPMFTDQIKRVLFGFKAIHGADAYDRVTNEVFSLK